MTRKKARGRPEAVYGRRGQIRHPLHAQLRHHILQSMKIPGRRARTMGHPRRREACPSLGEDQEPRVEPAGRRETEHGQWTTDRALQRRGNVRLWVETRRHQEQGRSQGSIPIPQLDTGSNSAPQPPRKDAHLPAMAPQNTGQAYEYPRATPTPCASSLPPGKRSKTKNCSKCASPRPTRSGSQLTPPPSGSAI